MHLALVAAAVLHLAHLAVHTLISVSSRRRGHAQVPRPLRVLGYALVAIVWPLTLGELTLAIWHWLG